MPQSLVEIAKDLTAALIETMTISPEDMQETLQQTYATLSALKAQEESGTRLTMPVDPTPPVAWRKSITKHAVTCLECGQSFKQLSVRHLRQHDLDGWTYREKYGIPRTQPLAARATTTRRREIVQQSRPWEKAPTYRKRHAGEHLQSTEPDAEAIPDETEALTAAAAPPAQPKRKTSSKKTVRKTRSEG